MDREIINFVLIARIGYDVIMILTIMAVLWWAIRNGQMKGQEGFSHLPLDADVNYLNRIEEE